MTYLLPRHGKAAGFLAVGLIATGVMAYLIIKDTADFLIVKQAEDVATIVGTFAKTARSVYAQEVIGKLNKDGLGARVDHQAHEGYVPIPAQYLKMLGEATTRKTAHLFQYKPVSKWNIEPRQGLYNDFVAWAWPLLEKQDVENPDGPIDWKPVSRVDQVRGVSVMRFLIADAADDESCVGCHNRYENTPDVVRMREQAKVATGKQWKQHQLLGALEIAIPLDRIKVLADEKVHRTASWIMIIIAGSVVVIGIIYLLSLRQRHKIVDLTWQADHDPLTELGNRRDFERSIELWWQVAKSDKNQSALVYIDLDGFKPINDVHGHQAGDEILKAVARCIGSGRRANDTVARLGGDEFAVILSSCRVERACAIAEQIRQSIEALTVDWEGHELKVAASIGVAMITGEYQSVEEIIEDADRACYLAKKGGKNRVTVNKGSRRTAKPGRWSSRRPRISDPVLNSDR